MSESIGVYVVILSVHRDTPRNEWDYLNVLILSANQEELLCCILFEF